MKDKQKKGIKHIHTFTNQSSLYNLDDGGDGDDG